MHFPKVEFLKFKTRLNIHYPSYRGEINCVDISKDFPTAYRRPIFPQKLINYNIYSYKF